jgi:hypothetical protein
MKVKKIKTEKDLITEIISLYHKARETKFSNDKIFRGRSHSISSAIEDLFAHYLTNNIECAYILIDQPLKIEGIKNKNIYPDLAIVQKDEIIVLLDLKTDLGWNRDGLYDLCKKHSWLITKIKGSRCSFKNGNTKEIKELVLSKKVIYDVVIVSGKNVNKEKLNKQIALSRKLKPKIDIFVLTDKIHPNQYNISKKEIISKLEINKVDFKKMFDKLN